MYQLLSKVTGTNGQSSQSGFECCNGLNFYVVKISYFIAPLFPRVISSHFIIILWNCRCKKIRITLFLKRFQPIVSDVAGHESYPVACWIFFFCIWHSFKSLMCETGGRSQTALTKFCPFSNTYLLWNRNWDLCWVLAGWKYWEKNCADYEQLLLEVFSWAKKSKFS